MNLYQLKPIVAAAITPNAIFSWDVKRRIRAAQKDRDDIRVAMDVVFEQEDLQRFGGSTMDYAAGGKWAATLGPIVVALCGLPDTGKTTIAKMIANSVRARHINSNVIRNALVARGLSYANVNELSYSYAASALACKNNVVMDSDNANPGKRALLAALAKQYGARMITVHVVVDQGIWYSRVDTPSREYGQFYIDAVERDIASKQLKQEGVISPSQLRVLYRQCLCDEYQGQKSDHEIWMEAGQTVQHRIWNNDSLDKLKQEAARVSADILDVHGTIGP